MKKYNLAVVGATGMVGAKMLEVLSERNLPVNEYFFFASEKSAGKTVDFMGKTYKILLLSEKSVAAANVDIALFAVRKEISLIYAPLFARKGTLVIDNSSAWRRNEKVPLVVPECNEKEILNHRGIIANPNCSTIQAVTALKPLDDEFKIKRIVYSTYQAVSGAGVAGFNDLKNGVSGGTPKKFPCPIFANCIPHIDGFCENGYTLEEDKMIFETKRILSRPDLKITATCVRVPVYYGHSEAVNAEFYSPCDVIRVKEILSKAKGVTLYDDPESAIYPTPLFAQDKDDVFVGRIRKDDTVYSGVNLWIVSDNLRKGAATNAVQIAEKAIELNAVKSFFGCGF